MYQCALRSWWGKAVRNVFSDENLWLGEMSSEFLEP